MSESMAVLLKARAVEIKARAWWVRVCALIERNRSKPLAQDTNDIAKRSPAIDRNVAMPVAFSVSSIETHKPSHRHSRCSSYKTIRTVRSDSHTLFLLRSPHKICSSRTERARETVARARETVARERERDHNLSPCRPRLPCSDFPPESTTERRAFRSRQRPSYRC